MLFLGCVFCILTAGPAQHSAPVWTARRFLRATQWLYFSCTSTKEADMFPLPRYSQLLRQRNLLVADPRGAAGLCQHQALHHNVTTCTSRKDFLGFASRRFKHHGKVKTLNLCCQAIISRFPPFSCNPPELHVQHLPHLLITGSIVPDNAAPAGCREPVCHPTVSHCWLQKQKN